MNTLVRGITDVNAALNHKPINSVKTKSATPAVEGWYFRAISGYPAAINFEPVVLFKNGIIGSQVLRLLKP